MGMDDIRYTMHNIRYDATSLCSKKKVDGDFGLFGIQKPEPIISVIQNSGTQNFRFGFGSRYGRPEILVTRIEIHFDLITQTMNTHILGYYF